MPKSSTFVQKTRSAENDRVRGVSQIGVHSYIKNASSLGVALFAFAGTIACAGEAVLSWTDNSSDEAGFKVERSANEGEFFLIGETAADTEIYVDGTVVEGVDYKYRVCAFNSYGDSGYTNVASYFKVPEVIVDFGFLEETARSGETFQLSIALADESMVEHVTYLIDGVEAGFSSSAPFTISAYVAEPGEYEVAALVKFFGSDVVHDFADTLLVDLADSSAQFYESIRGIDLKGGSTDGSVSYVAETGSIVLTDTGGTIGSQADTNQFAYVEVAGDFTFSVRLVGTKITGKGTVAGVMIRSTLEAGSIHATLLAKDKDGKLTHRARLFTDQPTEHAGIGLLSNGDPIYMRAARRGSMISYYVSADGVEWTWLRSTALGLEEQCYVGLALAAGASTGVASAHFDEVMLEDAIFALEGSAPLAPSSLSTSSVSQ